MSAQGAWFVIVNPVAGNGQVRKKWRKIKASLFKARLQFEYKFTEHHKHSVQLAIQAISLGYTKIVAVGGDGTIHNVVNGIMQQDHVASSTICFGVIPVGTGNDWIKTHGIPKTTDNAIKLLINGNRKLQDIGKLSSLNSCFSNVYFNNLAGVGFDGYVVNKIDSYKKFGVVAYLFGAVSGIFTAKKFKCLITIDDEALSVKSLMVLAGLCKYSGGGMQLTNQPNPSDGLFDVSIAENFSTIDLLKNLPRLFNGRITQNTKVTTKKASSIKVKIIDGQLPFIQADGELIGAGDFEITLFHKALRVCCP